MKSLKIMKFPKIACSDLDWDAPHGKELCVSFDHKLEISCLCDVENRSPDVVPLVTTRELFWRLSISVNRHLYPGCVEGRRCHFRAAHQSFQALVFFFPQIQG